MFLSLRGVLTVDLLSQGNQGEIDGRVSDVIINGTTAWTGNWAGSDGGTVVAARPMYARKCYFPWVEKAVCASCRLDFSLSRYVGGRHSQRSHGPTRCSGRREHKNQSAEVYERSPDCFAVILCSFAPRLVGSWPIRVRIMAEKYM